MKENLNSVEVLKIKVLTTFKYSNEILTFSQKTNNIRASK